MALKNTYWSLIELNGKEALTMDNQPSIHLLFHLNDSSLHGSDGCNNINADYVQEGDLFSFKHISSTKMFCEEAVAQSSEFLQVLDKTDHIEIQGDQLILFHENVELARFEAKEDY